MALTHLLDTSVLTRLDSPTVRAVVEPAAIAGALARPTIVDLEIGYSARSSAEWERLRAALESFWPIDTEAHHVRRALHVQRSLAEAGLRGRKVPDLVIAACAEDHGLTVLHYDADYDHIASITRQIAEWVVPSGSID